MLSALKTRDCLSSVNPTSRNTNARALATGGGLEVPTKNPHFSSILIGKTPRQRRSNWIEPALVL
ncbi:hypothetical protein C0075_25865, partial [Rhizobium sp. KAs_5_22]